MFDRYKIWHLAPSGPIWRILIWHFESNLKFNILNIQSFLRSIREDTDAR